MLHGTQLLPSKLSTLSHQSCIPCTKTVNSPNVLILLTNYQYQKSLSTLGSCTLFSGKKNNSVLHSLFEADITIRRDLQAQNLKHLRLLNENKISVVVLRYH